MSSKRLNEYIRIAGLDLRAQSCLTHLDDLYSEAERYATVCQMSTGKAYHIKRQIAEMLCAQVRHSTGRNMLRLQWWRCFRCILNNVNGTPAGLVTTQPDFYRCKAMAKLYGYPVR